MESESHVTESATTPPALARRYGCHVGKILSFIRSGELAALNLAIKRTGRPRWRITPEAIADFEAGRKAVPPAPRPRRQRRPKLDSNVTEYFQ
ncbi:MAG: hypothetical protein QUV05_08090 [Phycisphaerae bacterium]|nr:hypothetical protein [Phycisphaerae bacterium]